MSGEGIRYSDLVDYGKLDPVKKLAMEKFRSTLSNTERLRIRVMPVGETAAVLDFLDYDFMIAFNVEGLGTKNDIADQMYRELKEKARIAKEINAPGLYRFIGQDTATMSLMDLVSVGADPIVYGDFITAGNDNWFDDKERVDELLTGYRIAANVAGCAIPCGETPTLPDIVNPHTLVLEGASVGLIRPKERFSYGQKIKSGDVIYGLPTIGPNANGVSKIRRIANKLPERYFTKMPDGRTLGEAALVPTPVYVRPIIEMFDEAELHYVSPITGHAWEKVGRARFPFTYVIENPPVVPTVFQFLIEEVKRINPYLPEKERFNVSDEENYYVWNMGTSVALIAPANSKTKMRQIAKKYKTELQELGYVKEGEKQVLIPWKNLRYVP
ncbi:MAG: AIR synthase related protein [Candidatus Aenigmarchaeota archaeon]|nr:AIR synthase related protein [Candidatus Aenigmarchaeota archaeon]